MSAARFLTSPNYSSTRDPNGDFPSRFPRVASFSHVLYPEFLRENSFKKRIVDARRAFARHAFSENTFRPVFLFPFFSFSSFLFFYQPCRITRFDFERLRFASKFHEEPHYNRRIFGYIRGCSGVTDGTPGNCIGDITHEPAWKTVRSAPPRINWSTMPERLRRNAVGKEVAEERGGAEESVQGDCKITRRARAGISLDRDRLVIEFSRVARLVSLFSRCASGTKINSEFLFPLLLEFDRTPRLDRVLISRKHTQAF